MRKGRGSRGRDEDGVRTGGEGLVGTGAAASRSVMLLRLRLAAVGEVGTGCVRLSADVAVGDVPSPLLDGEEEAVLCGGGGVAGALASAVVGLVLDGEPEEEGDFL